MISFNGIRKSFIVKILCSLMFLCACFSLSGCFSKTPQRTYFSVDYTLGTQPKSASPKYNKSVVIQNINTALAYDRQEIVYRSNPYEFQYYWYRLWASKPKKMLRELILGHLRYTNLFKSVAGKVEETIPDYQLNVEILSIEELDVSDTEWYAHLNLEFTLVRESDKSAVWNYAFDARRPVADNQPVYVVKAMSELLDAELVKAFEDLDRKLAGKISENAENQPESIDESTENTENATNTVDFDKEPSDMPRATLKNKLE